MRGSCSPVEAAPDAAHPVAVDAAAPGTGPAQCSRPRAAAGPAPERRMPGWPVKTRPTLRAARTLTEQPAARPHPSVPGRCRLGSSRSGRDASGADGGDCPRAMQQAAATVGTNPPARADVAATRPETASWLGSMPRPTRLAGDPCRTLPEIRPSRRGRCRHFPTSCFEPSDPQA